MIVYGTWYHKPEELRFTQSYELKDANVLPSPAYWGSDEYVYREAATEMIKSELQKGRAVGICYHAVKSLPRMKRDDIQALIQKDYADKSDISEEDKMTRFELIYGTWYQGGQNKIFGTLSIHSAQIQVANLCILSIDIPLTKMRRPC